MAAQGYPGAYEKGSVIRGLDLAGGNSDDVKIFHAGTKKGPGGEILASGGRVLDVTAMAESHISIHSWPESGYAALDIFMCGAAQPHRAVEVLRQRFRPAQVVVEEYRRGSGL